MPIHRVGYRRKRHSTQENRSLSVYDNLKVHISIEVIEKARATGVHIITFPLHCYYKFQPLHVVVFASFKIHYNSASDTLHLRNPGQVFTDAVFMISSVSDTALDL